MKILKDNFFSNIKGDEKSSVIEIIPNKFKDSRGYFTEVIKDINNWNSESEHPLWMDSIRWIRQINRSSSHSRVIRGFHAQKGIFCQSKLVEAVNRDIFDVIIDARPDSDTFGKIKMYLLDADIQNKVFVPKGFLHSFIVPNNINTKDEAIFTYYCDNVYNHDSEICVNPTTVYPSFISQLKDDVKKDPTLNYKFYPIFELFHNENQIYSEKDMSGMNYNDFMNNVKNDFVNKNTLWYR